MKIALALTIVVIPGGLLLVLLFVLGRRVGSRWIEARGTGTPHAIRTVLGSLSLRGLFGDARALLHART